MLAILITVAREYYLSQGDLKGLPHKLFLFFGIGLARALSCGLGAFTSDGLQSHKLHEERCFW